MVVHQYVCKDNLLKRLPARLSGHAAWVPDDWRIVVLVDRDDDGCAELKARLPGSTVPFFGGHRDPPHRFRRPQRPAVPFFGGAQNRRRAVVSWGAKWYGRPRG